MSVKLTKPCPDLYQFDSGKAGRTVTILGGVHGNEKPGIEIVRYLIGLFMTEPSLIQNGKVNIGIGNPASVKADKRFVEHDLNRSFGALPPDLAESIEAKRAEQLKPILADTDVLIDIHSTAKPSDPMILSPTSPSVAGDARSATLRSLLPIFGIKNVLTGDGLAAGSTGVCTDTYVWQQGGLGICLETGWREDTGTIPRIQRSVLKALEVLGISP